MKKTLYHGSLTKIIPDNNRWGIYLSESVEIANDYIMIQSDNAVGEYGYVYSVEIDEKDLVFTDDIDQLAKCVPGILYNIEDGYYRIDNPEKYQWNELSYSEIYQLLLP